MFYDIYLYTLCYYMCCLLGACMRCTRLCPLKPGVTDNSQGIAAEVWTYIQAVERSGLEGSDESEVSSDEENSSDSFEEESGGDDDNEGDRGDSGGDGDGGKGDSCDGKSGNGSSKASGKAPLA
jgi:hypothetical protein